MKYIVLVGDGMAGKPLKALGYKTCLQKACTPNMDRLAAEGEVGIARTIPKGFEPGSDVANLSILGYDPKKFYTGRAPIEAEYRKIRLGPKDVAFRCNLVTLSASCESTASIMEDFSAGHITTREAAGLINFINKKMGSKEIAFYPGVSYRHLMIWKNGLDKIKCIPPHDITGRKVNGHLPEGKGSDVLNSLMEKSHELLLSHSINKKRIQKGLRPASSLWFWGQGKKLVVPRFKKKYGLNGALISAVALTKGLGICAGFENINVRGATGYIDTNYVGKANAALRALKTCDFVYVHVEAPDEAGHSGDMKAKIQAIEDFDAKVVGVVMNGVRKFGDYRVLLLPDHFTPIKVKTHPPEPVPFVIFGNGARRNTTANVRAYSENICKMKKARVFEKGHLLMDYFLNV
jgi:2,3-bisphosphoglycerate-independent phosphoglycerate mutase